MKDKHPNKGWLPELFLGFAVCLPALLAYLYKLFH